jgi:hypothetical protein
MTAVAVNGGQISTRLHTTAVAEEQSPRTKAELLLRDRERPDATNQKKNLLRT